MSPLLPAISLKTRLESLRRDVRTVVSDLFGSGPAPFTVRAPLGRHARVIPSTKELLAPRSVRVGKLERPTADSISLELAFDPLPAFHPGQFMTLVVTIDGVTHRRAYSIHSAPSDERIAICVKRVKDGKVSNWLVDRVREGDTLQVLGPSGSFGLPPDRPAPRRALLVGGGSGITPLASIARALLARDATTRLTLLYGNRSLEDVIFREQLEQLAAAYPERFELRHVLESPPADWLGGVGRLDEATCERELGRILSSYGSSGERAEAPEVFVCGPEGLMDAARAALLSRGVEAERVHEERFSSPGQKVERSSTTPQPVTIHKGDKVLTVIAAPGQTLLEAGLAGSVDMPFSCAMGGCAACKVKLLSGEVASEEPNCLSEQERRQGFVLACVSRACGAVAVQVPEGA